MEPPTIANRIRDEERNINFIFMAYRQMTYTEMVTGVQILWQKKKKPRGNSTITVLTLHGARG